MRINALLLGALFCALAPGQAYAAPLGGGQSPDINLLRIGLSLLLCIMVAGAAILVLRRKGGATSWLALARPADSRAISVKETRRISLHADLCRFECDGQEFLVVVTPQNAVLLRERQVAPPAPP